MEWIENGKKQVVSIYDEGSHKWHEIGQTLGLSEGVLDGIKQDSHSARDRLSKVLESWCENACGLSRPDHYPKSWIGLINLLNDSGLGELAIRVRKALLQQKITSKH